MGLSAMVPAEGAEAGDKAIERTFRVRYWKICSPRFASFQQL